VERLIGNTGSTLDAAGIALYRKLIRSPGHVAAALRMMANWDLAPLLQALPQLKPRLILVTADNDRAVSPAEAVRVQDLRPGTSVQRLQGLGHLAHEERPQLLADLIVRYASAALQPRENARNV
jgi:magnesium chelatase accessory protein